jgi:hypothetical protein
LTTFSPDEGDGETEGGLAGLNLDLGTYVSPELALFVNLSGTSFTIETGFGDLDFLNGFFGVVAQYWITPQVSLGGGAGLGIFAVTSDDRDVVDDETGPAIMGRASYRIAGSWQAMLSLTPSFYDGATVTSTSFLVAYQWD